MGMWPLHATAAATAAAAARLPSLLLPAVAERSPGRGSAESPAYAASPPASLPPQHCPGWKTNNLLVGEARAIPRWTLEGRTRLAALRDSERRR